MCDDTFGWWFRFLLNVTSGALFGVAFAKLRSAQRELAAARRNRALTEENLTRATKLFGKLLAFPGDDDDPPAPTPLH